MEPKIPDNFYYNLSKIDKFIEQSQGTMGKTVSLNVHDDGRLYTYLGGIGQSDQNFGKVVDEIDKIAKRLQAECTDKPEPKRELKHELLIIAERYNQPKYAAQTGRLKEIAYNLDPEIFAGAANIEGEEVVVIPEELFLRIRKRLSLDSKEPITMDYLKKLHDNPDKLNDPKLQNEIKHVVTSFGERFKGKTKIYGGKVSHWTLGKVKDDAVEKAFDILYNPLGEAVEPTLKYVVNKFTTPLAYVPYAGKWLQQTIEDTVVKTMQKTLKKGTEKAADLIGDGVGTLKIKAFADSKAKYEKEQLKLKAKETAKLVVKEGTVKAQIKKFTEYLNVFDFQTVEQIKQFQTQLAKIEKKELQTPLSLTVSQILHDLDVIKTYSEQTLSMTAGLYGLSLGSEGLKVSSKGAIQSADNFQKTVDHLTKLVKDFKTIAPSLEDGPKKMRKLKFQLLTIAQAYTHPNYNLARGVLIELADTLELENVPKLKPDEDILEIPHKLLLQLRAHVKPDQEITFELLKEMDADPKILNSKKLQEKVHALVTDLGDKVKEKTKVFGSETAKWGIKRAKKMFVKEVAKVVYDPFGKLVTPSILWGVEAVTEPVKAVPFVGDFLHKRLSSEVKDTLKDTSKKITKKTFKAGEKKVKELRKPDEKKEKVEGKRWVDFVERDEEKHLNEQARQKVIAKFEKKLTALFLEDPRKAHAYLKAAEDLAFDNLQFNI